MHELLILPSLMSNFKNSTVSNLELLSFGDLSRLTSVRGQFSWCLYLAVVPLGLAVLSLFPGAFLGGWVIWFPVVVWLLYLLGAPYLLNHPNPGLPALWLTLVTFLVVVAPGVGPAGTVDQVWLDEYFLLDALSWPFVVLTVSLAPVVVLASLDSIRKNQYLYYSLLLALLAGLVVSFCVTHFLTFYLVFELLGFPMFLLIGLYGPRAQRISAAYKFFIYTFGGSAFILPVLTYLYFGLGSTEVTFLVHHQFTEVEEAVFFALVVAPFLVKVPVVPVHLWLPEAHVEAPTPVSMVLAALLLKTGGYAFVRFVAPVFPGGVYLWGPLLNTVGVVSVCLASVYALVQVDLKRLVAYASVAHMSVVFVGLLAGTPLALQGGVYLMIAHGYISAGLFAGIGVLYDRYHTRTIRYLGGLAGCMPLFGLSFFVLTLGNLSFPFTGGFTGEFMLLLGIFHKNSAVALLLGSTVLLSLCYSVWLYNRVFYGPVSEYLVKHQDLTPSEAGVLLFCATTTVVLGFMGGYFSEYSQNCYTELTYKVNFQ